MMDNIVEYCSDRSGYSCGYCGSSDTNFSHGLWAHSLKVAEYQDLIDRGWRRCGKYCYKPTMDVTCCPMYTIRCNAIDFKATKSQKKILKFVNKYLMGKDSIPNKNARKMSTSSSQCEDQCFDEGRELFVESSRQHHDIDLTTVDTSEIFKQDNITLNTGNSHEDQQVKLLNSTETSQSSNLANVSKVAGPDPFRPACKKAKQLRRERRLEKLKEKGVDVSALPNTCVNKEKPLEAFIAELPDEFKNKLEIKLVRTNPPSSEWIATAKDTHEVYVKYQTVIHNDTIEKCSEAKFRDFLVKSPLIEEYRDPGPTCGYGSFHQQYWLDGKLIAVGVIDILPKCVSSVYFFYDPAYMNLTLGTYGALREIEFTRRLHKSAPELQYYYMGFYIHSCKKMRYKGNFHPSDLLCPETYKWFPIKECIPKLEISPYSRCDPDLDSVDENYPSQNDLNFIPVWYKGNIMLHQAFRKKYRKRDDTEELMEYAQLVGRKTSSKLVLFRG